MPDPTKEAEDRLILFAAGLKELHGSGLPALHPDNYEPFAVDLRAVLSTLTALREAATRHAEGLSFQLAIHDWRPSRSHIEGAAHNFRALASASLREPQEDNSSAVDESNVSRKTDTPAQHSDGQWRPPEGVPTYEDAVALVVAFQKPSCSFIQRKLQVGYNRAAEWVEQMEAAGIVSRPNSAGARTLLAPANGGGGCVS